MPTTSILAAIKQLKHFKTLVYAYNRIDCFAREAEYAQKHASEREHLHDKLSLHREWMLNLYYLREQYPIKLEEPITSYEAAIKEWVKLYKKWAVQCEEAQVLHDLGVEVLTDLTTHESLDFVEARLQCHIGRTKNAKAFEKRRELQFEFNAMERKLIEDLTPTLEGKIRDVIADNIVAVKHTEQTVEGLEKKIAGCEKTLEHEEKRTVDLERRIAECKSFIEEVRGLEVIVFVGDELVDEQVI